MHIYNTPSPSPMAKQRVKESYPPNLELRRSKQRVILNPICPGLLYNLFAPGGGGVKTQAPTKMLIILPKMRIFAENFSKSQL